MRWGAVMLTLVLTACWQGKPMGKEWSMQELMGLATDTLKATGAVEEVSCRDSAKRGLETCFAVNGSVGSFRTAVDDVFAERLHRLGDWEFHGENGAVTYETRTGQTLQVGLVYSPNDEFRSFPEKLPEGANGVLYVIVEPAPFQP
nr:hypothetical protein D3W47_20380 [Deinococcus sp. RM]